MESRILLISITCLFKAVNKDERKKVKKNYLDRILDDFNIQDYDGEFKETCLSQIQKHLQEKFNQESNFNFSCYKVIQESYQVLDELKQAGFRIVITSDSSFFNRVVGLLNAFNFSSRISNIITYSQIKQKKSSPDYLKSVQDFLSLPNNSELYVISTQVHKEMLQAHTQGIKHIWINQEVRDHNITKEVLNSQLPYPRSIMSITLLPSAIEHYSPSGIQVAYMLPTSKKMSIMGLKKTFLSTSSFWYNSIWPYCHPSRAGTFQVFINKAVDLLSMEGHASQEAFESWAEYLSSRSNITAIDPLGKCKSWLTREQFITNLNACLTSSTNGIIFRIPFQIKLSPGEHIPEVQFPVIVKSNVASVAKMSHIMSIAFNQAGLEQALKVYQEEFIIQEFINHDMTVYKIYVIGNEISYKPRPSCSNISGLGKDLVTFNSAEAWPEDLKSGNRVVKDLDMESIREMTGKISEFLGLSIYGYDILVHSQTGEYVVVDVNVFPGFKEYSNINPLLESLIQSRLARS